MSQMSSALAGHTSKPFLIFRDKDTGKEYPVSLKTQEIKIAFCEFLEERARGRLLERKQKEEWSRARWERAMKEHEDDITAGEYEYDSSLIWKSLQTPMGSLKMASLLFGVSTDEMRDLVERHEDEISLIIRKIEAESAPRKRQGNAPAPAREEAGAKKEEETKKEKEEKEEEKTNESASTP